MSNSDKWLSHTKSGICFKKWSSRAESGIFLKMVVVRLLWTFKKKSQAFWLKLYGRPDTDKEYYLANWKFGRTRGDLSKSKGSKFEMDIVT